MGYLRVIPKEYMKRKCVYMRQCDDETTEHAYYLKDITMDEYFNVINRLGCFYTPLTFSWLMLYRKYTGNLSKGVKELFWWCLSVKTCSWFNHSDKVIEAFTRPGGLRPPVGFWYACDCEYECTCKEDEDDDDGSSISTLNTQESEIYEVPLLENINFI